MEKNIFTPNERTENIIILMLDMVDTAIQTDRKLVISCGLGLDIEAAFKRGDDMLTRNHGDLDVHPLEQDIPFWRDWFSSRGFTIEGNEEIKDTNKAFVAYPSTYNEDEWDTGMGSYYIDVYGIMVDEKGFIHTRVTGRDESWGSTWDDNFEVCKWRGRDITVMKHEKVLSDKRKYFRKSGKKLREKDLHDHNLFGIDPNKT